MNKDRVALLMQRKIDKLRWAKRGGRWLTSVNTDDVLMDVTKLILRIQQEIHRG